MLIQDGHKKINYDDSGRILSETFHDTSKEVYIYNSRGILIQKNSFWDGSLKIITIYVDYDLKGNILEKMYKSIVNDDDTLYTIYKYDIEYY